MLLAGCQATAPPVRVDRAWFSPSGQRLAFVSGDELRIGPAESREEALVVLNGARGVRDLRWAPGGLGVVFWHDGRPWVADEHQSRPLAGIRRPRLSLPTFWWTAFWSDDGTLYLLRTEAGERDRLLRVSPAGDLEEQPADVLRAGDLVRAIQSGDGVVALATSTDRQHAVEICERGPPIAPCRRRIWRWAAPRGPVRLLGVDPLRPGVWVLAPDVYGTSDLVYLDPVSQRADVDLVGISEPFALDLRQRRMLRNRADRPEVSPL